MEIFWYGDASLIMREGDAAIAFDPFFGVQTGCFTGKNPTFIPKNDFSDVTDVFVTHGHFDHIYHLPTLCNATQFQIHCTATPRKTLIKRGVPAKRLLPASPGKTDYIRPFGVTAFKGRHCMFDLPIFFKTVFCRRFFRNPGHLLRLIGLHMRFRENGEILFYEILCGGKRIQVMGSLGLDKNTDYPTGADILILPFQGRSDLEKYALEIVKRLKPKAVFLDHYDDAFPPITSDIDTKNFEKILSAREHIPCRAMKKGSVIYVETKTPLR